MIKRKWVLCLLMVVCTAAALSAETFYLKDGNRISGQIVSHEDGIYTVTTAFGIVDIEDEKIDRISDRQADADEEEEIREISIVTNEQKRNYTPEYEDEKYHDPLYIAYSQAKVSAVALTASGSVFFGLAVLETALSLPIYFAAKSGFNKLFKTVIPSDNSITDEKVDDFLNTTDNLFLSMFLPFVLVPGVVGFCLIMAAIGPWIYASKMLHKWQSKYHVHMSMSDGDKLSLGLRITL